MSSNPTIHAFIDVRQEAAWEHAKLHIEKCDEALEDEEDENPLDVESPASAPYDGCEVCIMRETVWAVFDYLLTDAEKLVET